MQRNFGQAIQHASPLLMAMSKGLLTGKGAGAYMDQGVLGMHMMQKERQKEAAKKAATEQFNSILGVPRPAAARSGGNQTVSTSGALPKATGEMADYIREAAKARGIDPEIAVRVAASEGLNADPNEAWQSKVVKNGKRERSYGPFQLYIDGGLGNDFMRDTGLDPRNAETWKQQVDYALDHASKNGWGAWYGAKNIGLDNMAGIGGAPSSGQPAAQNPNSILALMANPDIGPGQRAVLQMLYQQGQQQNDPLRQLQIEQMELDLEAARNPEAKPREREKDANGRWRYVDDGSLVFSDVEQGPKTDVEGESKLRKEFVGLQPVKDFQKQAEAYGRIVASAKDPSPAGDLALIFNYMKVLDPGSVVRESEFATAANAAAVPDRIRNIYNKVLSGERLTPEQRIDFVGRAAGLYEQAEQQHDDVAKQYGITAESYGFERDRTIPDFRYRPQGAPPTSARPQARAGSEAPRKDAFSNATMADLLKADVSAMKDDELDAWERRYHELSK